MYSRDWVRFENSGAAALASNTSSGVATNESVSGDWPIRADTNLPDDKGLALVFAKRTQFSFFLRCRAGALPDPSISAWLRHDISVVTHGSRRSGAGHIEPHAPPRRGAG